MYYLKIFSFRSCLRKRSVIFATNINDAIILDRNKYKRQVSESIAKVKRSCNILLIYIVA